MTTETKPLEREGVRQGHGDLGGTHRVIKNSLASAVTGASIALMSIAVPPVLARTLAPLEFSAWSLVLQIAGYVSVLDLGIQNAVGRYVAYYSARMNLVQARKFASTSFNTLCVAAVIGLGTLAVADIYLHALFPQIPHYLIGRARLTLGLVGVGIALGLPASVFRGMLTGIERYELVMFVAAPTGLLLSITLSSLALAGVGIVGLGIAFAIIKVLSYGSYWAISRVYTGLRVRPGYFDKGTVKELWGYCSSSMIWTLGMLMISGLDVAIVARVEFSRVAAYAACVAPITIIAGAQTTIFKPLLQVGSRYFAAGEMDKVRELMHRATRICVVSVLLTVLPIILLSHQILAHWLGNSYANQADLILQLLLTGQAIRLVATPYATLLLATNNHRITRVPVLSEAIANTGSAVLLGIKYGATGVACGVIVGATVGQLMNFLYNYPKTKNVVGDGRRLITKGILVPSVCFVPLVAIPLVVALGMNELAQLVIGAISVGVCAIALWKLAIDANERAWVGDIVKRRFLRASSGP